MATDLGQPRGSKRPPAARYESYAQNQLSRVESRIRALDLGAAVLGFIAATLAFALLMIFADRRWELSAPVRQAAFLAYVVASVAYIALAVVRPLRRRVNPYYAALKLEETLPEAKNSVINWVDLHQAELAPAISAAVGQRAAHDLAKADMERAVSGKKAGWTGAFTGILFVLFLTAFIFFGPRHFFSLFRRSFVPFEAGGISSQTNITILRPEGGDAVFAIGRPVTIAVQVRGRLPDPKGPDALRLLYRYQENDPFIERPLQREAGDEWAVTVNIFDVQNGFWYKVAGGDGETEEYRITVRSTPLLTGFRATYQFRPYTGRPAELRRDRRLEAVRGTSVDLHVRTNRPVKEAFFDFYDKETTSRKKTVRADKLAEGPQGFQTHFVLEESGHYRINYTSTDGETYVDPNTFPIVVHPDDLPVVELTKPGKEVTLPANGVLNLEGRASDDFGVKKLVLRMQLVKGSKLKSQPYRSDKELRLKSGGYPTAIAYKDFVDLAKVSGADGMPLVAGQKLEYWLEATDACDYPKPNIGISNRFVVRIAEPEQHVAQQKEDREKAAQEKQRNDAQQDEQNKKEDQRRQEDARQRRDEIDKQNEPANQPKEAAGKDSQKQNGQTEGDKRTSDEGKADNNPQTGQDAKKQQDLRDKAEKLEDALTKKESSDAKQPDKPGQGKQNANEDKQNKQENSAGGGQDKENQRGQDNAERNDKSQPGEKNSKGEAKGDPGNGRGKNNATNPQPPQPDRNAGKEQSTPQGGNDKKDNAKEQPAQQDSNKSNGKKDAGKDQSQAAGSNEKKETAKQQSPSPNGNKSDGKKELGKEQAPTQGNEKKDASKEQSQSSNGNKSADKKDAANDKTQSPGGNGKKEPAKEQSPSSNGNKSADKKDAGKQQSQSQGSNEKKEPAKEQSPSTNGNKSEGKRDAGKEQSQSPGSNEKRQAAKEDSQSGNGNKSEVKKDAGKEQSQSSGSNEKKEAAKEQSQSANGNKSDGKKDADKKQSPSQGSDKKDSAKDPSAQKDPNKQPSDSKSTSPATEKCDCKGEGSAAGAGEPKASPRQGGKGPAGGQAPRGEDKQAPAGANGDKVAKGQPKGDRPSPSGQREEDGSSGKMDKVLRLTRDLKSKDKATREKAVSELEKMDADQFEELLQQYKDLLDKQSGSDRLRKKPEDGQKAKAEVPGDKFPDKNDADQAKPGDGKRAEKDGREPSNSRDGKRPADSKSNGKEGDKPGQDGKPADGQSNPKNAGKGKDGRSGETPGTGVGLGNNRGGKGSNEGTADTGPEPARFRNRAGVLQLEEFKRKVDRNVLKDAKISEQEYREFLKGYEEMLKKPGTQAAKPEVLPGPQSSSTLPSLGGRALTPTGTATDVKSGSRPLPPPRYRDPYREFTRQLANPDAPDK